MLNGKSKYVGKLVDVRFLRNRRGLAGTGSEFEKIAFLDKFTPDMTHPNAGEGWQCRVVGDSKPDDPQRGALFVVPLERLQEKTRWFVVNQSPNGNLSHLKPKIEMRVTFGKQVLRSEQWSPGTVDDILNSWPDWVQNNARRMFQLFEREHRKIVRCRRERELAGLKESHKLSDPVQRTVNGNASTEFKFQWVRDWLTNGTLWIPREYPAPYEWRKYSIPRVPNELWETFLQGLEGKFLEELIPFHKRTVEAGSRKAIALTVRQQAVQRVVESHMWEGAGDCERIAVGVNVIFIVESRERRTRYLVDNPGIGAIYIFDDYEQARLLATGSLARKDAIKLGVKRICHSQGWEGRLTTHLLSR